MAQLGQIAWHQVPCVSDADPDPFDGVETLTTADATQLAREQLACEPGWLAEWLYENLDGDVTERDPQKLGHASTLGMGDCLALIFSGSEAQALTAVFQLRRLWEQDTPSMVRDRAADLLIEQQKQVEALREAA
jgi:hypothetical protein